jgi:hypothetical protein
MDHLVLLKMNSGDLGKILRGVKRMIVREVAPSEGPFAAVRPGDTLYFLRNDDEGVVRVKATVVNTYPFEAGTKKDMPLRLKELQVNLQLTEPQYDHWATKKQALFIEFRHVHKTPLIRIDRNKHMGQSEWISIEDISIISG